ncbi:hypothetical protein [uncultured Gimesia sp.]|uniref:hypothetical protein n=1 Tax=uncultured Gimesia sp. TaxID=1678688 RepID=UPI0030D92CCA|tara:strand:+ start:273439 stop:274407 length:969 start_codon:yes stop_codon:yes gene_type:complete
MNFQEYRAAKETYLKSDPLRLDCMNTQKALSHLAPPVSATGQESSLQEALSVWQKVTGFNLNQLHAIPGIGVRDLLTQLVKQLKQQQASFIFPRDVYPVYHQILDGYPCRTYRTLPDWEFDFLIETPDQRQVLLLTQPAVPVGRYLNLQETTSLVHWLAADPSRLLIIDAAYAYEPDHSIYAQLLRTSQCICLFSLSKPWLMPEQWGIAVGPKELLESHLQSQDDITCNWVEVIRQHAALPAQLRSAFLDEWSRLTPAIHYFAPHWQPPQAGYYSTVNIPFAQLLREQNVLGVPASVFGSDREDVTVISCLFAIQQRSLLRV